MPATVDNVYATDQGEALPVVIFLWVDRFLWVATMSYGVEGLAGKRSLPSGPPSELGVSGWH